MKTPERKRVGRPSILTQDLIRRFDRGLRSGAGRGAVCRACGVSHMTVLNWLKRAERGPGIHREFRDAVIAAEEFVAEGQRLALELIGAPEGATGMA